MFLILLNKSLAGQTYTIPFAEKQPAWVFPLWFTNGDGQKDTIYFAYDSEASKFVIDTIFGEYTMEPSPSGFQVRLGPNWKVFATDDFPFGVGISIFNRIDPFRITFDPAILYSDSLPGSFSDFFPKVWAGLGGSGFVEDCPTIDFDGFYVALVDTTFDGYPVSPFSDEFCISDSAITVEVLSGTISISFSQWNPPSGISYDSNHSNSVADAWIDQDELVISVNSNESLRLQLYHFSGVLLYERLLAPGVYTYKEELKSKLDNHSGLIIAIFIHNNNNSTKKLLYP